jgi:type IV pilus assembly protein PilQ
MSTQNTALHNHETMRSAPRAIAALALWLLAMPAWAASVDLTGVEFSTLAGDAVEVRLQLSAPVSEPLSFTIEDPARIAVDLADTGVALERRVTPVGQGDLRSIVAAEGQGRTRVVFNLNRLVPYDLRVEGSEVVVTLTPGGSGGGSFVADASTSGGSTLPTESTYTPPAATSSSGERALDGVDFRRGQDGTGRILIRLSDPSTPVDVRQEGDRILVSFRNTSVPQRLVRRLDVTDFATPVQTIDTLRVGDDAQMIITGLGEWDELAYQADRDFTIELRPLTAEEVEEIADAQREFSGDRLTLNFQDIETRAVLQILADFTGLNIVVSDTVTGNVTLRVQNVPWDQVLDIVMQTKGLDMRQNGNVILIAPADELAERERAALESRQQISELEPLRSEFIQVNYAKAADLAALLSSGDTSLLSGRGTVSVDDRTNTLLVQDTSSNLENVRRLVRTLDIPIRQVQIESRIVIASDDFGRDIGVRLGYTGVDSQGSNGLITTTGTATGNSAVVDSAVDNIGSSGQPFPVALPDLDDRLNVNLPLANPAGSFGLAILGSDYLVELELQAAQAEGRGEVVSSPRIITGSQQEAIITSGVQIPYQEASASGATTTTFIDAVLSLQVTPQITPDDRIIMDLEVHKDNVGEVVPSATGGFVPSIDTRTITTQVLVNNGETVVLGGVYEIETLESETKVPWLGDIPVIGAMFRSRTRSSDKSELLIFVTPKIIRDGENT